MRQTLTGWVIYRQELLSLLGSFFAGCGIIENINPSEVVGKGWHAFAMWRRQDKESALQGTQAEGESVLYLGYSVSFPPLLSLRLY